MLIIKDFIYCQGVDCQIRSTCRRFCEDNTFKIQYSLETVPYNLETGDCELYEDIYQINLIDIIDEETKEM